MDIFKLEPYYSEKVWGYEEWNLSTHRNGNSIVSGSEVKLIDELKNELPILIKIIQANEKLSVQVHPHDEYSRKYENDNGKTECWYILEADENASLICGIKEGLDKDSFAKIIENGTVEENLRRISVKKGDMIVTSGSGGIFPKNLLIGKAVEVQSSQTDVSLYATVEPYVDVKNVKDVLIITDFAGQGDTLPDSDSNGEGTGS